MFYYKHSTLADVYYSSTDELIGDMFIPVPEEEYLRFIEEAEKNGNN